MTLRVGIDVGGTFTDVTAFDEQRGELAAVRKYLSNPADPAAVLEHITRDLAQDFGANAVSLILHGSTAALNTLLEGKGVRVGLLTTRGFQDAPDSPAIVYNTARRALDQMLRRFAPVLGLRALISWERRPFLEQPAPADEIAVPAPVRAAS